VLWDKQDHIILLFVEKLNNYQLPGGGIELHENHHDALKRETLEETGYKSKVLKTIGLLVQYSQDLNRQTNSFCYLTQTVGKPQKPQLTAKEIQMGYKVIHLPFDEALSLTSQKNERTFLALTEAKKLLRSS